MENRSFYGKSRGYHYDDAKLNHRCSPVTCKARPRWHKELVLEMPETVESNLESDFKQVR